jgi:hypothetical protein
MTDKQPFVPKTFAVIGAGPVGCIVSAFLAKGGYDVILCDVIPDLLKPALKRGIIIEGAEKLTQTVSHTCTSIDSLPDYKPDVIFVTVKANVLPLIASAIEGFHKKGLYVVSWQNGIDTELVLAKSLGKEPVMRAVVNYGCGLLGPAHVTIPFHHPPHFIQELDPEAKFAADAIADALAGSPGKKGTIRIQSAQCEQWAEIRISDTGTGIPESVQSKIFDPFFTTKPVGKGTGQGLAISASVVANHGGSLSFETQQGVGTTFILRLPLSDREA